MDYLFEEKEVEVGLCVEMAVVVALYEVMGVSKIVILQDHETVKNHTYILLLIWSRKFSLRRFFRSSCVRNRLSKWYARKVCLLLLLCWKKLDNIVRFEFRFIPLPSAISVNFGGLNFSVNLYTSWNWNVLKSCTSAWTRILFIRTRAKIYKKMYKEK